MVGANPNNQAKVQSKILRRMDRFLRSPDKGVPGSRLQKAQLQAQDEEGLLSAEDDLTSAFHGIHQTESVTTVIPEVHNCFDWGTFVNLCAGDSTLYAIEALIAGPQIEKDQVEEYRLRCVKGVQGYDKELYYKLPTPLYKNSDRSWLHCIRVQSQSLLNVFNKVTNYGLGTRPLTFRRPFRYLIHFHDRFKEELQRMEADYFQADYISTHKHSRSNSRRDDLSGRTPNTTLAAPGKSTTIDHSASTANLENLRCYVKFAEKHIMPLADQFAHANYSHSRKIRFTDLWYLFKPGELVYIPTSSLKAFLERRADYFGLPLMNDLKTGAQSSSMHQKIVRLLYTSSGRSDLFDAWADDDPSADENDGHWSERGVFELSCYFLDYDGSSFSSIDCPMTIKYFEGERDIRMLDFYPIRFAPNAESCVNESLSSGLKYVEYLSQKHMSYAGWDVITSPLGEFLPDPITPWNAPQVRCPLYIESEVIIDFKETFNIVPAWQCVGHSEEFRQPWKGREPINLVSKGRDPVLNWSSPDRTTIYSMMDQIMVSDEGIATLEHDAAIARDYYYKSEHVLSHLPSEDHVPVEDDLVLLPNRLFAYALRHRMFFQANIQCLKPIPYQAAAFDQLELPDLYRKTITALMDSHFQRKRNKLHGGLVTQDFIYGKGGSLVIMLHGEPGVGKTATAEAVAQKYRRPLFSITCGDLGVVPAQVEEALSKIFRLSYIWDCVLLLDEADIFLTARNANDLSRNGIVTVFLRIMEYYNGVLFMTTNRIGKLDPAIVSRVHISLHYKKFGEEELRNVFKLNIEQLKHVEEQIYKETREARLYIAEDDILQFASEHYHRHKDSMETSCWNGRQIRNAFVVASALARQDGESKSRRRSPQLLSSHFEEVEKFTSEFDMFRAHLMGGDDSHLALKREERFDNWAKENEVQKPLGDKRLSLLLDTSPNNIGSSKYHMTFLQQSHHQPAPLEPQSPQSSEQAQTAAASPYTSEIKYGQRTSTNMRRQGLSDEIDPNSRSARYLESHHFTPQRSVPPPDILESSDL